MDETRLASGKVCQVTHYWLAEGIGVVRLTGKKSDQTGDLRPFHWELKDFVAPTSKPQSKFSSAKERAAVGPTE